MEPNGTQEQADEKPRTLFIGNIPSHASKWDIENIFAEIGPLKRIHFQYPKNFSRGQDETTVAYVTYALPEDATTALEKLRGVSLGTNNLSLKLSKQRSLESSQRIPKGPRFGYVPPVPAETPKPKKPRQKTPKKKSRLIIRNLSFQVTEDKLREHFQDFGDIQDINILKKPNGKLVGCAFIQYKKVSQAAKALRDLNLKEFLGRPIAIDWALPIAKFQEKEIKEEADEKPDLENTEVTIIKEESADFEEESIGQKTSRLKKEDQNDSASSESSEDEDAIIVEPKKEIKDEHEVPMRKLNPNDADEGKTLFIRNLNFDTTSEQVKHFFLEFGPVCYGVICKDPLTEHSKGTAFIKFRDTNSLEKCMDKYEKDPGHFVLDERQFYVSPAMSKAKLAAKITTEVHKEPKDKRNLYLVREGFIRPGTTAGDGISAADKTLRATLHRHKRQMLKDLNNFISDKRLCVHNLPEKFTDKMLRTLFRKHGGPGAKILEARIMRDKKVITPDGFKSKGFGFVTFSEHENALAALRALNNNPEIFSRNHRPVVEFSLEKKAALIAREKRTERSKEKLKQIQLENQSERETEKKEKLKRKKLNRKPEVDQTPDAENPKRAKRSKVKVLDSEIVPEYGGLASKPGISSIPSLKPKGKITRKSLKAPKPKSKKLQPRRKREGKSKPTKDKSVDDQFEKRVSAYKNKNYVDDSSHVKRKAKWYA